MGILRKIYKLLPSGLKGMVIQVYYSLSGWHFDDLKKWMTENSSGGGDNSFIAQESYNRLSSLAAGGRSPIIAIVSPTPPTETGIANCTIETYRHANYALDIYSSFSSTDNYLSMAYAAEIMHSRTKIYSLDTLSYGKAINNYRAIVYTLGNSSHNLPYMVSLFRLIDRANDVPVYVHLHDPVVLNLLRIFSYAVGRDFIFELEKVYGKLTDDEKLCAKVENYQPLVTRGICGVTALFGQLGVAGIIVNSVAGETILKADLANSQDPNCQANIERLFHPVFPPSSMPLPTDRKNIRIGTFGIPSSAKCTELVVQAFRMLREEIPDSELVIAGFNANRYAQHHALNHVDGIIIVDSPSNFELQRTMASCHLGIQLRSQNVGESSGVIPQLLANNVPVLTSKIGAFAEYGDAVSYAPPNVDAAGLLRCIMNELRGQDHREKAMLSFTEAHSPTRFCSNLLDMVAPARLHLISGTSLQADVAE
jgi:glycosyltransferase involved in cell wall biosynthesis